MCPPLPLGKAWETVLDRIFPPRCGSCAQTGSWLCDACRARITYVNEAPTPPGTTFPNAPRLRWIYSVAWFEGPIKELIHNFKYQGQQALRVPLAELLLVKWQSLGRPADLIIAVPLHPRREKARGYNQSYLLASEMSRAARIPAPRQALFRTRDTRPQISLNMKERWDNVRDAFQGNPDALRGRRVLLVDDVCTTGATLEASAQAAFRAGALDVSALTVARPRSPWE